MVGGFHDRVPPPPPQPRRAKRCRGFPGSIVEGDEGGWDREGMFKRREYPPASRVWYFGPTGGSLEHTLPATRY